MSSHQDFGDAQFRGTPQTIQRLIPTEVKKTLPRPDTDGDMHIEASEGRKNTFADLKTFAINQKLTINAELRLLTNPTLFKYQVRFKYQAIIVLGLERLIEQSSRLW